MVVVSNNMANINKNNILETNQKAPLHDQSYTLPTINLELRVYSRNKRL